MERSLSSFIKDDLKKKAVLLSGPRQVGRTTLAKQLFSKDIEYLNYDILADRKIIISQAWRKNCKLIVLDELHKLKKWKNFLKGVIDEYRNSPPLIITGSARLEVFRTAGDSLTGRTFSHHLMPIDVKEACTGIPERSADFHLTHLLKTGGFPESFFNPNLAPRLLLDRIKTLLQEDLRDLSRISEIKTVELLIALLRERVGGQVVYSNIAKDLFVSSPTIKSWIELLEKLYLIFLVKPFATNLAKSLRKEPKCYFYDNAAALNGEAAKLENLVAVSLLKWCHFMRDTKGREVELHYYRDSEDREVDFIISEKRKALTCIEVKLTDDTPSPSLKYLTQRLKPKYSLQLVQNLRRSKDVGEIRIRAAAEWLKSL